MKSRPEITYHISFSKFEKEFNYLSKNRKTRFRNNYYGWIGNQRGYVFINLKIISKNYPTVIDKVVRTISHEIIHNVLYYEQNKTANKKWDNIAHKLEHEGYLGEVKK